MTGNKTGLETASSFAHSVGNSLPLRDGCCLCRDTLLQKSLCKHSKWDLWVRNTQNSSCCLPRNALDQTGRFFLLLLLLRTDSPRVLAFGFLKPSLFHLLLHAWKLGDYLVSASLSALSQVCQHNSLWAHAEIGKGADLAGGLKKQTNKTLSSPSLQLFFAWINFMNWLIEWPRKQLSQACCDAGVGISGGDEKRGKNNLAFKVDCYVRLIMQGFITVLGKKLIFERWEKSILDWNESLWRCSLFLYEWWRGTKCTSSDTTSNLIFWL